MESCGVYLTWLDCKLDILILVVSSYTNTLYMLQCTICTFMLENSGRYGNSALDKNPPTVREVLTKT